MIRHLLPLLLVAASLTAQPQTDTSRPLFDSRDVVGIVTNAATLDVYWLHTNEFADPIRSALYRTVVSADGQTRIATSLVRQFDRVVLASVSGEGANVQVMWSEYVDILASPIVDGMLKYPAGKPVSFGLYAGMRCHASECVVIFDRSSAQHAAILDADSNVVSGPFALPAGWHPLSATFDERGIFFMRHNLTELRAALVRRDGSVQYDVKIANADPRAFHAGPIGMATRGTDYVVAFVDFEKQPDEVQAVTISADGTLSTPLRLLTVPPSELPNNVGALSLAWNGTSYLLIANAEMFPLGATLQPAGTPIRGDSYPVARPHPDGSSFIVTWQTARPFLTILKPDGSMTAPLDLIPPAPRRRAVR